MNELVSKYPSLIARPYFLIKDNSQKKDIQRFWFENTMSFLAVVSSSILIKHYTNLKAKEELSVDEEKILEQLKNNPSLTNVGFEHMSLGKWVGCLRESIKAFNNAGFKSELMTKLDTFYKAQEKNINKLVSIRNADAHGEPIPEEKLKEELDKRQILIEEIIKDLGFISEYDLILPEKLEIENGKPVYLSKIFKGNEIINSKLDLSFNLNLLEVVFVDKNQNEYINLTPYILYLGVAQSDKNFLGIFSSYINKEQTQAKYLNIDGNGIIDWYKFSEIIDNDLFKIRQNFIEIYSDPAKYTPSLNMRLEFDENSIILDQISSFKIIFDNKKGITLYNLNTIINIPSNMEIISNDVKVENSRIKLEIEKIEDEIIEKEIEFKIKEQGTFVVSDGFCEFEYYESESDKDFNQKTTTLIELNGNEVECIDPKSRDKMIPVININRKFINTQGEKISSVKIGEEFIFSIEVTNIGFSSAKNVSIDLTFPENLNLKDGKEIIILDNLNPQETKIFQYVLTSKVPNVYNISLQNITYYDLNHKKYTTQCADDYYIIVRSDLLKEFKFKIEEFIEDLYIDEDEQKEIDKTIKEIEEKLEIDGNKFYKESEYEAVINIIRKIVEKTAIKKDIVINESIYQENQKEAKYITENPRKFLVYSVGEFPFFAINLDNMEFYGMRTPINKRFNRVKENPAIVNDTGFMLNHMVNYDTVRNTEEYSVPFFNQWINMILSKIQKEYLVFKEIVNKIEKTFNTTLIFKREAFYGDFVSVLKDKINPNTYIVAFASYSRESIKQNKNLMQLNYDKLTKANLYLTRKRNTQYESYLDEPERLSYYHKKSSKQTFIPAIEVKIKSIEDVDKIINKAKELYKELWYIKSLDIFNENEGYKEFITKLYKKGFGLRDRNENNWGLKYEIVNMDDYLVKSNSEDAIGYIEPKNKGYDIYIRAYDSVEKIKEYINIRTFSWKHRMPLYLLQIRQPKEEVLEEVFEYILEVAESYSKEKLFVLPKPIQKELILGLANIEYGVLRTFLAYAEGKTKVEEVSKYFPIEEEFYYFIRRNEKLENEYKILPIFNIDDRVEINKVYVDIYERLKEEKPDFNYLTEGFGYYRLVSLHLRPLINIRLNIGEAWLDKTISVKLDLFKRLVPEIAYKKGGIFYIKLGFKNVSDPDKFIELVNNFNFKIEIEANVSNVKNNTHMVLKSKDYEIGDIEENKYKLADTINLFFEEMDKFLSQFNLSILEEK